MAEVSRIQGPSGSPDPKKDKAVSDADRFKEMMKVEKVRETDPEEQKKRKQRKEEEEETQAAPTPPGPVAPFSLDQAKKAADPFAVQAGTPRQAAAPTKPPPPLKVGLGASPTEPPPEDETPPPELNLPDATTPQPPVQYTPPPQPAVETSYTPSTDQTTYDTAPDESSAPQPMTPQPTEQPSSQKPQETEKAATPQKKEVASTTPAALKSSEKIETSTHLPAQKAHGALALPPKIEKEGPPVHPASAPLPAKKAPEEEKKVEEESVEGALAPTPSISPQQGKGEEKEKEGQKGEGVEGIQQAAPLLAETPTTLNVPLPAYTNLHPQVLELFERMVGTITVMNSSGITETTINLTAPQFASSVFYGSQIIIKEFSTAPYALNIQLLGTPQAVALFQGNTNDLMAAFQSGNYNFRINRLETGLVSVEKPLFKRKESVSGEGKDQQDKQEK